MSVPISGVKGVSANLATKLQAEGIKDSDQLLEKSATPAARKALAGKLGVDVKAVLELANRADLIRVRGIGGVFSDLLENAGVDTVKELAGRVPANLQAKLKEISDEKKLANLAPTLEMVTAWIAESKTLPKILEY